MIIPSTPHNGIIITIVGALISIPLFVWAYVLYRRPNKKVAELGKRREGISVKAETLLIQIHNILYCLSQWLR